MNTPLEEVLMKAGKDGAVAYLRENPEDLNEAICLALTDKQPYSWRAAWLLSNYIQINDDAIRKHTCKIISALPDKKGGHQRELMRILLQMELRGKSESILFDYCVSLREQINKSPSIRYTAFKHIRKTVQRHPALKKEISFLFRRQFLAPLTDGTRRVILKMLKEDGYVREGDDNCQIPG